MWVIVKYAARDDMWSGVLPKHGVPLAANICDTYTGEQLNVKPYYLDFDEATAKLMQCKKENPTVDYALCPLFNLSNKEMFDRLVDAIIKETIQVVVFNTTDSQEDFFETFTDMGKDEVERVLRTVQLDHSSTCVFVKEFLTL